MSTIVVLCSNENKENLFIEGIRWTLDRYLRTEDSKIRRALRQMSFDLGSGINIDLIIDQMNSNNCFDFEYKPIEKDRLVIRNHLDKDDYKYFGLIFRDSEWTKGDYYTTRIPYKGTKVISEIIAEGKIIKRKHNRVDGSASDN